MHTMTMIHELDGTEEWLCSTCGRHLLISRTPVFKKTILVEGDPVAEHTRIKKKMETGDRLNGPTALLPKPVDNPLDDPRLVPWLKWMEESGFEELWGSDDQ